MTVEQAAERLGKPVSEASRWLRDRGYRYSYSGARVLRVTPTVDQVEAEVQARYFARPPAAPCFRCGARGECAHR